MDLGHLQCLQVKFIRSCVMLFSTTLDGIHCKKYPLHSDVITNWMCEFKIFLDRLSRTDCLGPWSVISTRAGGEECIRYFNHSNMLTLKQRFRNFSGLYEGSWIRFQIVNFSWDAYDPILEMWSRCGENAKSRHAELLLYCSLTLLCELFSFMSASSRRYTRLPIMCQELTFKRLDLARFRFSFSRRKRKNLCEDVKNQSMSYGAITLAHYNLCIETAKEADFPLVKFLQAIYRY